VKYDSGDYEGAYRQLEAALREGLPEKRDQVRAMKHMAFSLCLQGRPAPCRVEFAKVYEVDAAFDLSPAEAGHPSWAKTFAAVKKAQEAKVAREARDKAARDKAAPPAAPKKN
jgi:hypothetical protein